MGCIRNGICFKCEQRNLLFSVCLISDQGWWDKPHRRQFWRSSQLYSPCQCSELPCWHPTPWKWRRASVLNSRPSWAPHAALWRLARQWFSALPHHTTCAARFCQLWKIAILALCWRNVSCLYLYFWWAILSPGTLYIIKTIASHWL